MLSNSIQKTNVHTKYRRINEQKRVGDSKSNQEMAERQSGSAPSLTQILVVKQRLKLHSKSQEIKSMFYVY